MKTLSALLTTGLLLFAGHVSAAPSSGRALERAVVKMNTCYTADGAIQFYKNGVAIVACAREEDGAYNGSYDGSYGGSYSGPYVGPYQGPYVGPYSGPNGCQDTNTNWVVRGSKVLLLMDGAWKSVTIGFRSSTCTIN